MPATSPFGLIRAAATSAAVAVLVCACAAITPYDATSYKNATDLKAQALLLVDEATEPAADHRVEIETVRVSLQQALEYERGKGDLNALTVKQWQLLANPNGDLLGGFLRKWESEGPLGRYFVEEKSKQIAAGFDEIVKLERHKVKR